jgi:hypothetical protein
MFMLATYIYLPNFFLWQFFYTKNNYFNLHQILIKTTGLALSFSDKLYPAVAIFSCNAGRDEFKDEHLHHSSLTQQMNQGIKWLLVRMKNAQLIARQ